MSYPSIAEYIEALSLAPFIFQKYNTLIPVIDEYGQPVFACGNVAVVFKMHCIKTGNVHAVKVFHRPHQGIIESYNIISKYINNFQSKYLVHYDFCENEIKVNDFEYPAIIMEWIEGTTLGEYLQELIEHYDTDRLHQLAFNFDRMSLWLLEQHFAHGDLNTDNILIDEAGAFKLIDYDGMFTPEMHGQLARENGSPGFRHPGRLPVHFGPQIDDFSILLISFSLHALAIEPDMTDGKALGENLILFEEELIDYADINIFKNLSLRDSSIISPRMIMLQMALGNDANTRLIGLKGVIQDTALYAEEINSDPEFEDPDFEIYWDGAYCGFRNKKNGAILSEAKYDDALPFKEKLAAFKTNGKWGYVNSSGNEVIIAAYNDALLFFEGLALVKSNKYGYINKFNELIIPFKFEYALNFENSIAIVKNTQGYSLIDKNGIQISEIYREISKFNHGLATVERKQCGLINSSGKIVVPLLYEILWSVDSEHAVGLRNNKWFMIKINENLLIELEYDDIYPNNNSLYIVVLNNKWGLLDNECHEVVTPQYDYIEQFSEGLSLVTLNKKSGFINQLGEIVIDLSFDRALSFQNEKAIVSIDGEWAIINKLGHFIIKLSPGVIEESGSIDGFPIINIGGKKGIIDFDGNILTQIKYDEIDQLIKHDRFVAHIGVQCALIDNYKNELSPFNYSYISGFVEGIAMVELNGLFGFIDTYGRAITEIKYTTVSFFNRGIAIVELVGKKGLVNKEGIEVTKIEFDAIDYFEHDLFRVAKESLNGLIDRFGNEILGISQRIIWDFKYGLTPISTYLINGKYGYGYIDKTGSIIIEANFDEAGIFYNGLALVKKKGLWGYIDTHGKITIEYQFEDALSFMGSVSFAKLKGKWGLIDQFGNYLTDFKFEKVDQFDNSFSRVKLGGKWGFIDESGVELTEIKFDDVGHFSSSHARIKLNGKDGYIDKNGKEIY